MDKNVEKLRKKAIREQQKRMKPGECQKYVRLVLDGSIVGASYGSELLTELNASQLKFEIKTLPEKYCVVWERSIGQLSLLPSADVQPGGRLCENWQMENQVMRLLSGRELKEAVKNVTLPQVGERLHSAFPELQHTVVVLQAKEKNSNASALASSLVDLQLLQEVHVLQIPNEVRALVDLLRRYTKSIAEAPYKQQKSETLHTFKKYLANDKKQCVRVEGSNGLGRLWQQHLTRLPLVTLEVAESIISQHSCPSKLLEEFTVNPQALTDLKISRGAVQPLQTDRRIGSVLNNKIYNIYHTRDPNALL